MVRTQLNRAQRKVLTLCVPCLACSTVFAQTGDAAVPPEGGAIPASIEPSGLELPIQPQHQFFGASPVGTTDVYGNAQYDLPDRRPLGIYANEAEWQALGGYQLMDRPNARGGPNAFALPGELLGLSTMQTLSESISPWVRTDVSPARRLAMREYGGFGNRYGVEEEDGISSALSRRRRLIAATSLYSPVYRAMMRDKSLSDVRPIATRASLLPPDFDSTRPPDDVPPAESLYEVLKTDVEATHASSKAAAWELLAEGDYRQAGRAFEAALVLDPDDSQARIGEIFSYVAMGAISTAAVLIQQLDRRDANPFLHQSDVPGRLRNPALVDQLLSDSRLRVESMEGPANPNLQAADVFILWHLGDRETAIRAADALAAGADAGELVHWSAKTRAAQSALHGPSSR